MEANVSPRPPGTLRVCYFGTYRATYTRNRTLIEGLQSCDVEVLECHAPLWLGIEDRVRTASGGWLSPAFLRRVLATYASLLVAHSKTPDYDVMILGYPGQFDTFLARLLTWARKKPLVLDVLMSPYLVAYERGVVARHPLTGRLIFWLEKLAYRLPDLLIQDTQDYVDWLCRTFRLDASRFRLLPIGANDRIFRPADGARRVASTFQVVYYGSFIPNHAVETIVGAARLVQDQKDIRFELIGDGPDRPEAERQVQEWGLANVTFTPWLEKEALVRRMGEADLCLGAFGTTPQSMMTVHNKIWEGLAMRLCVVTGDSPAVRRVFTHGQQLWLCKRADPASLASAILALKANPALRASLAEEGYRAVRDNYTLGAVGSLLRQHLHELVGRVRS